MRVRYEIYKDGHGTETITECDLIPKKARKLFEDLKTNAKCGWCELVAEDEEEGGYMKIIDSHDNVRLARMISTLI